MGQAVYSHRIAGAVHPHKRLGISIVPLCARISCNLQKAWRGVQCRRHRAGGNFRNSCRPRGLPLGTASRSLTRVGHHLPVVWLQGARRAAWPSAADVRLSFIVYRLLILVPVLVGGRLQVFTAEPTRPSTTAARNRRMSPRREHSRDWKRCPSCCLAPRTHPCTPPRRSSNPSR